MMEVSPAQNGILRAASTIWTRFWASGAVTLLLAGVALGFVLALILIRVARPNNLVAGREEVEGAENPSGVRGAEEVGGAVGRAMFPCA